MGVYQDEIDNNIQPLIDKLTADKAKIQTIITFLEGLASDINRAQFLAACSGSAVADIQDLGTNLADDATDSEIPGLVEKGIDRHKTLIGTHSSYTGFADHTVKVEAGGTDSDIMWKTGNLTDDIAALETKKTAWAAKEADETDTSSYTALVQPDSATA